MARRAEADLELDQSRLNVIEMAGITGVENPQAAAVEGCEPLPRYGRGAMPETFVEGDVWLAAFDGAGTRRRRQGSQSKRAKHRLFHVPDPSPHASDPIMATIG
jgi:hypothetical protein